MKTREGWFWLMYLMLIISISVFLVGCEEMPQEVKYETRTPEDYYQKLESDARFVIIGENKMVQKYDGPILGEIEYSVKFFVDTETEVVYLMYEYGDGVGISPLLDCDGKPMIWDGENIS